MNWTANSLTLPIKSADTILSKCNKILIKLSVFKQQYLNEPCTVGRTGTEVSGWHSNHLVQHLFISLYSLRAPSSLDREQALAEDCMFPKSGENSSIYGKEVWRKWNSNCTSQLLGEHLPKDFLVFISMLELQATNLKYF